MEKEEMVIGILFSKDESKVLLILKDHPDWQRGKYNFPGGHIENNETPRECVIREMREETGLGALIWWPVGTMEGEGWFVHILSTKDDGNFELQCRTEEVPKWFPVNQLPENIIPNLRWLVPLALDKLNNDDCFQTANITY
jgi:8-oxo-dGTP diphosphatase